VAEDERTGERERKREREREGERERGREGQTWRATSAVTERYRHLSLVTETVNPLKTAINLNY